MLPNRLKRPKMGVRVPIQKIWPRHRRWVRSLAAASRSAGPRASNAHLRSAANAGTGQIPHDIFGVSLCRLHHQHRIGADAFNKKYGIDLWDLAAEFASRSPDWEMRASLKLVRPTRLVPPDRENLRLPSMSRQLSLSGTSRLRRITQTI
jgi:hypothetical protein